jgi:hypothetical protein
VTRACFGCGGTEADGCRLPVKKPVRRPLVCQDCAGLPEAEREARIDARRAALARGERPRSRRSYRAALAARARSPQGDLADLLVPAP